MVHDGIQRARYKLSLVSLSVCPSHEWICQKRWEIASLICCRFLRLGLHTGTTGLVCSYKRSLYVFCHNLIGCDATFYITLSCKSSMPVVNIITKRNFDHTVLYYFIRLLLVATRKCEINIIVIAVTVVCDRGQTHVH